MKLRTHFRRLTGYWHDTFCQTRTAVRAVAMATGLLCGVGRRTDDPDSPIEVLIQAYLDRYQIEFNHRDAKTVLGVGEAQVWGKRSTPRVPEFIMAAYSALLLAGLAAYGPQRGEIYRELPKWRRKAKRPSCQDLVTLLRQQLAREVDTPSTADQMILTAAA